MREEYLVRVGPGFIGASDADKLITRVIREAKRFNRDDAELMACYAGTAFPDDKVFIAHQARPDRAFDFDNPNTFIVSLGRTYLKSFTSGRVKTTFILAEAARYTKYDSRDVANMLSLTWPDRSIHAAHEESPFIAIEQESLELEGRDETEDRDE